MNSVSTSCFLKANKADTRTLPLVASTGSAAHLNSQGCFTKCCWSWFGGETVNRYDTQIHNVWELYSRLNHINPVFGTSDERVITLEIKKCLDQNSESQQLSVITAPPESSDRLKNVPTEKKNKNRSRRDEKKIRRSLSQTVTLFMFR